MLSPSCIMKIEAEFSFETEVNIKLRGIISQRIVLLRIASLRTEIRRGYFSNTARCVTCEIAAVQDETFRWVAMRTVLPRW